MAVTWHFQKTIQEMAQIAQERGRLLRGTIFRGRNSTSVSFGVIQEKVGETVGVMDGM